MDTKQKSNVWNASSSSRSPFAVMKGALATFREIMAALTKEAMAAGQAPAKTIANRPILVMHPHHEKLVDVMLCLLHEAERLGMVVTTYELVKAVFLADRAHLNRYRRPITYDRYLAMRHGPVGHAFYNMLKEDPQILRLTGPVEWSRRECATPSRRRYWAEKGPIFEYFAPERDIDPEDGLSPSDVEALQNALREVKRLGISGVWRKTHRDPAWRGAFVRNGGKKSYPMDPVLMLDTPSERDVEALAIKCERRW